jgi:hypothetical protein
LCHFQNKHNDIIASFRLHMEDNLCWSFFKTVNNQNLHPNIRSSMTFNYGSSERKDFIDIKNAEILTITPESFKWLNTILAKNTDEKDWCKYHGVDFRKIII